MNEILSNWGVAIGAIGCIVVGCISYYKGYGEGLKKKDGDIERMLDKAIKRAKEDKN